MKYLAALLAAAVVGVGGWLFVSGTTTIGGPPAPPDLADPALVAMGEDLYAAKCASCHGADLQGEAGWRARNPDGTLPAPPHDETGHTWHHPDAALFAYTKHGGDAVTPDDFKSAMPGFGGELSDREIWAVLAYIKSRWPARIRERQEAISRQAQSQ